MGLLSFVGVEVWVCGVCEFHEVGVLECTGTRGVGKEKRSEEDGGGKKTFHFVFTRNKINGV